MSPTESIKRQALTFLEKVNSYGRLHWIILFGSTLLFAVLLFPNLLIPPPLYKIGDVASKDMKSSKDFLVEDEEATIRKRGEVARLSLPLYDFDDTLHAKLSQRVADAFEHMRDWSGVTVSEPGATDGRSAANDVSSKSQRGPSSARGAINRDKKQTFESLIGVEFSTGAYEILEKHNFSQAIPMEASRLLRGIYDNGVVGNKLFVLRHQQRGIIVRKLSTKEESKVLDLQGYLGMEEAGIAISRAGKDLLKDLNYPLRKVIIDMAQGLLQPNITLNKQETDDRIDNAVAAVKPILTQIKQGEMLVREGEKITQAHMAKLQLLESELGREQIFTISAGFLLLSIVFLVIFFITHFSANKRIGISNKDLLFMSIVLVGLFLINEVVIYMVKGIGRNLPYSIDAASTYYSIPAAAASMTICLLMGFNVAMPFALTTAFLFSFLLEHQFDMFVFFLLSGTMGTYWVRNCKERGVLIKAGVWVGLVNIVVATALHFFKGGGIGLNLLWDWAFSMIGGVSSGILATGLVPVGEMAFAYTTDIKLLEMGNLERPILRRLMLEAAGTYHHSVIVGSLAEAAAAAIGANPMLAKVGGYYHDIGKIKKPTYFIENQGGCKNKHDALAPSMSSLILMSHVKEGVEIANNNRLGKAIVNIIQQHHGTRIISYFYEKAKKLKGEDAVQEEPFRYPGPKPQTVEAAIVLLADAVEAASRSMENPTTARIKGLVQRVINDNLLDAQLDECEVTLKDLSNIGASFYKTLSGIYHSRIEYPTDVTSIDTRMHRGNGSSDRRPSQRPPDPSRTNRKEGEAIVKLVGVP